MKKTLIAITILSTLVSACITQIPDTPQPTVSVSAANQLPTTPSASTSPIPKPEISPTPPLVSSTPSPSDQTTRLVLDIDNKEGTFTIDVKSLDTNHPYTKQIQIKDTGVIENVPVNISLSISGLLISQHTCSACEGQSTARQSITLLSQVASISDKAENNIKLITHSKCEVLADQCSSISDKPLLDTTVFSGKVYDDENRLLNGVTISGKSLNPSVPFDFETSTAGGSYSFNNAPAGVQIEILAKKSGLTNRRRVEVLKANSQGDPNINRFDFGNNGTITISSNIVHALSDKPEVINVEPRKNSKNIEATTNFELTFSEPMDHDSVEDHFIVESYKDGKVTNDFKATKSNFDISWDTEDTKVTFSFKNGQQLLTSPTESLMYQVSFDDDDIKDKSGVTRGSDHFRLNDTFIQDDYLFSVVSQ